MLNDFEESHERNKIQREVDQNPSTEDEFSLKFCSKKDMIPMEQSHNVVYHIECPGCGEVYVGKTNCCLGKRFDEHDTRQDQPMHIHLSNC